MYLRLVETKLMSTLATDGRNIYFNKEFVDGLSDAELMFAMAHEVMHVVFKHVHNNDRVSDRNKHAWNLATDYVINSILVDAKFEFIKGCLYEPYKFKGWNSEKVYDYIMNDPDLKEKLKDMKTLDDHDMLDGTPIDACDKRDWVNRSIQAAQKARAAGKLPNGVAEVIDSYLSPKIDFYSLLDATIKSVIKDDHCIVPPHKKLFAHGIYMYGYTGSMVRIVLAIDSSGSVSSKELQYFVGVLNDIMGSFRNFEIDVLAFSSHLHSHKKFITGDNIPAEGYGFEDRGGTHVSPVFDWIEQNVHEPIDALIIASDGDFYEEMPPAPDYEVIWVLSNRTDIPKFGTVLPLTGITG